MTHLREYYSRSIVSCVWLSVATVWCSLPCATDASALRGRQRLGHLLRQRLLLRQRQRQRLALGVGVVPVEGPQKPDVIARGPTHIQLKWDTALFLLTRNATAPADKPSLWNVLLDRVSVYSGEKLEWEQTGLTEDTCYEFQLAFFRRGRWSQFSEPRRIATTARTMVDVQALDAIARMQRELILSEVMSGDYAKPCDLDGPSAS